jgi:uncharacterized phosphosugar-binding protein
MVEGVGVQFCKKLDVRKEDVIVLISNSGRNPLPIEIAMYCKEKGAKIIAVTNVESSKSMTSRHSSGKKLYEFADVILDNCVMDGDASVEIPGLPVKVGGTSSISAALMENVMMLEAIEIMVEKGFTPPIFMSANVDGGPEFNEKLTVKYFDRLYHV